LAEVVPCIKDKDGDRDDPSVIIPNLLSSFLEKTKKVIGKFKDEAAGKPILEFIGLKSKMYSYRKEEHEKYLENKTAEGVKKILSKKRLTIQIIEILFLLRSERSEQAAL